ncbi:hypothetical protein BKA63DRAFT_429851 [Paraphoma chrysanthemicola]|nr:hypothetical protein BKA63DRAFT_429851 [Paraphoma chrysanthemicola]
MNWKENIDIEVSLPAIDWEALTQIAKHVKQRFSKHDSEIECKLSAAYKMGGVHVIRRLDFEDGTRWVARLQRRKADLGSAERLKQEVHTIEVIRERSKIPVPEVFWYDASCNNVVGVPYMLLEFIPADSAMDSFGGHKVHRGRTPPQYKTKYLDSMATIQVEMTAIRFPMIGGIVKLSDGTYSVGKLPGIGGPFETAVDFFCAWARNAKFPYREETIRKRTSGVDVDAIIKSIKDFPAQLSNFAKRHSFQSGPFPVIHADLYKSNLLVDSKFCIQGVIDWESAIVGPWEIVEFIKDLCIVPSVMDGPLWSEVESDREMLADRKRYISVVKTQEDAKQLDHKLSQALDDWSTQNFAHAFWLYEDGRIGFYTDVLNSFS